MDTCILLLNRDVFFLHVQFLHKQEVKHFAALSLCVFAKRTLRFSASRDPPSTFIAPRGPVTGRRRASSDNTVHKTTDTLFFENRNLLPSKRLHPGAVTDSSFYRTAGTASLYRDGFAQVLDKTR